MDDDPNPSIDELLRYYPNSKEEYEDKDFLQEVKKVVFAINSPEYSNDIELDTNGSDFQNIIWGILRQIEVGYTMNYSEIAVKIGRPKSARAVARACASNKIAILVPCHRVIRKNGELSGYRWGEARKKAIIEHERNIKTCSPN